MNNAPILLPRPATNRLAEEEQGANIHRVVKYALSGAIGAHRKEKDTKDAGEKAIRQAELAVYLGIVTEAISIHEAAPILYNAITVENIHDVRRLHKMALNIQLPEAA